MNVFLLAISVGVTVLLFAFRTSGTASPFPPRRVEFSFRHDRIKRLLPITRLHPLEEDLERLIYRQNLARL